jgi:hypothetical protein
MAHNNHVEDGINKDVPEGYSLTEARDYYLNMCEGWIPSVAPPEVTIHDGVMVVRDDLTTGTKTRAADLLTSRINHETLVYVQPRVGLAGVALTSIAAKKGHKVVLFMPASKEISDHQAVVIERGATPIFKRIAAMPNLNKLAKEWAEAQDDAFFIPLGLKHPLATAAIIYAAYSIPEPDHVYVAISTGVLSRALQIAWPNARFTCVAVARNLKAGELGRANVVSHPFEFQKPEKTELLPPFATVNTYDAKVWRYVPKNTPEKVLMWNVGREPVLNDPTIKQRVNSNVPWEK